MAKLFEKQRTNFYYNWLSFIEDLLRSFLVCFFMGHSVCVYLHVYLYVCVFVFMCVSMHVSVFVCVYFCVFMYDVCVSVCISVCTYVSFEQQVRQLKQSTEIMSCEVTSGQIPHTRTANGITCNAQSIN